MSERPAAVTNQGRPLVLYAIVGYALVLVFPSQLSLPSSLPLGRFTLEGSAAGAGLLIWEAAWLVAIGGLAWRRIWGCRIAIAVFGLHAVLVVSNTLRWLADTHPPLSISLGTAIRPSLQLLIVDLLVLAYLRERRDLFMTGRGFRAAWSSVKNRYQELFGLGGSAGE